MLRILILFTIVSSIAASVAAAADPPEPPAAAESDAAAIEELRRRVAELEQKLAEEQALIEKLLAAASGTPVPAAPEAAEPAKAAAESAELEQQLAQELGAQPAAEGAASTAAPTSRATEPIALASGAGGRNYLNLSLDGLIAAGSSTERDVEALQTGGHDPHERGFTVQNAELVLDGAVDPYFKGQANVVMQIDGDGETVVELEELYATTTSLPHGLQVKAGQFFTEFGRLNPQHPHSWDFVDQPLVHGRLFGEDGLRSAGARLSWLMPAPFYSELLLAVQNPFGETVTSFGNVEGEELFGRPLARQEVRSLDDLLLTPRYTASVNPSDTQTILFGASATVGPNSSGTDERTRILGLDFFWKWKPLTAQKGFPFVSVQAEGLTRRYEAGASATLPADVLEDGGSYAQVVWGIKPRWLVAARLEEVDGESGLATLDPALEERRRYAAAGTWFPTEFSKLRLQYNHDDRTELDDADSLWFQLEFLLGAHAAHKF